MVKNKVEKKDNKNQKVKIKKVKKYQLNHLQDILNKYFKNLIFNEKYLKIMNISR